MRGLFTERLLYIVALAYLVGSQPNVATAQLLGPEFRVNSYTTNLQAGAAVGADGAGNFVVVWHSNGQDGSYYGVFGQRHTSSGAPLGSEFQVNSYTIENQQYPRLAVASAGSFVVVWQDGISFAQWGVFGQCFDSAGTPVGSAFQVNTTTSDHQVFPVVSADGSGNFVVAWQSDGQDGSGTGVFGRRFSLGGTPLASEFQINTVTTGYQNRPAVAVADSGAFVVVWESADQDGSGAAVIGQRFDSAGTKIGTEFQANTYTTDAQKVSAVAADGSGNFVVVWNSLGQDGSYYGVFGQRFDALGTPLGSEFQVNTYTTGDQQGPAVAADAAGNFLVTWSSENSHEGSGTGVFGQRYSPAGARVGDEFQVNSYTTSYQAAAAVAAGDSGHFVVAWSSDGQDGSDLGVFGQRLSTWIFIDGFRGGDACVWSAAVGGGCP